MKFKHVIRKSETTRIDDISRLWNSFNSRTRKGATKAYCIRLCLHVSFNSRTRKGATLIERAQNTMLLFQFTHP